MKKVDDANKMGLGTATYTACTYSSGDTCADPATVTAPTINNCSDIPSPTG